MAILQSNIPTSLGDLINIKAHLDTVKHKYQEIRLTYHTALWAGALHTESPNWAYNKQMWEKYLNDVGQLFFSERPYVLNAGQYPFRVTEKIIRDFGITPIKPELGNLLCKGTSLNLGEEYIVITTKVREVLKRQFFPQSIQLWKVMKGLAQKYKIVILGERIVEMRKEYDPFKDRIFGLYDQIIANIPKDRILDLTVPALGETPANLAQVQQDCLIMKEAKFVITVGNGGNFCLSTAVANMAIGYRGDNMQFTNAIFSREYSNAVITQNWTTFIQTLERYL